MKIYICGYSGIMADFVRLLGHKVVPISAKPDCFLFTGGADVSPSLYGESEQLLTFCNPARDKQDIGYWMQGVKAGIPMAGICRGAQFLNVMNNGKLHQHVEGHTRNHVMFTNDDSFIVSSTHHQMIILPEKGAELLAWAGEIARLDVEPEVVYYSKSRSLAVQYHPEYMREESKGFQYFKELLESKFN